MSAQATTSKMQKCHYIASSNLNRQYHPIILPQMIGITAVWANTLPCGVKTPAAAGALYLFNGKTKICCPFDRLAHHHTEHVIFPAQPACIIDIGHIHIQIQIAIAILHPAPVQSHTSLIDRFYNSGKIRNLFLPLIDRRVLQIIRKKYYLQQIHYFPAKMLIRKIRVIGLKQTIKLLLSDTDKIKRICLLKNLRFQRTQIIRIPIIHIGNPVKFAFLRDRLPKPMIICKPLFQIFGELHRRHTRRLCSPI